MSRILMTSLTALLPLGFAWGAAAGGETQGAYSHSPTCDIRVVREGGSLVLEGLVFAPVPAAGSYELKISQGGHASQSSIRQGGDIARRRLPVRSGWLRGHADRALARRRAGLHAPCRHHTHALTLTRACQEASS
jgi:hypothetical protein